MVASRAKTINSLGAPDEGKNARVNRKAIVAAALRRGGCARMIMSAIPLRAHICP